MTSRLTASRALGMAFALLLIPGLASAQRPGGPQRPTAPDFPTNDPVLKAIWAEGMEHSEVVDLAQYLADVIGPRMTGTPSYMKGVDWAVSTMKGWGIDAKPEPYGTWRSWERGVSHIDLLEPRVRSLEGQMLGWSAGTNGVKEGGVEMLPAVQGEAAFRAWLPNAKGKFILLTQQEASCRTSASWLANGLPGAADRFNEARTASRDAWTARIDAIGMERQAIVDALEEAGAVGFLTNYWTGEWGIERIFPLTYSFRAMNRKAAAFNLSCEDYNLVYRLADKGQGPRLRAVAEARDLGEQPMFNVVGTIPGTELPNEFIMLSAHFDAWDGASGMTDNATGSVVMMEAMRILKKVYPNPKRTIVIGLWGAEEQGLIGSRAYAADHPEIVDNLHVFFNQDNGTGRIVNVSTQGLTRAGEYFARWFSQMPGLLVNDIDLTVPGSPGGGGSDYASFICSGAPAFSLGATSYDYGTVTWHTNRDTFDKIAPDDLTSNATLVAYLVYLASEEAVRMPRDRRDLGTNPQTGEPRPWPACSPADRETTTRFR